MNLPELSLEARVFPCTSHNIQKAREFIRQFCEGLHLPASQMRRILLAADEAVVNAIDHGSAIRAEMNFRIECGTTPALVIIVKDFGGKPFDPEYFEEISPKKNWGLQGGRGIYLISSMMDEVMYVSNPGKSTSVCMIKYLKD